MADITIQIKAEDVQAVAQMDKTAAAVRNVGASGSAAATGLNSAATGFKGLVSGLQRATTLFGAAGVIGGVFALIGMATRLYGVYKKLTEVNREYASEAKKAADAAKEFGMTAAGLVAVRKAADEANVPADLLNEKLKEYKEHKSTFDELASAVGKSADELRRMQDEADRGSVGSAALADYETSEQKAEQRKADEKREREGLRLIAKEARQYDGTPRGDRAWDKLVVAAKGDEDRALAIYKHNQNPLTRYINGGGGGTERWQIPAAMERYQARQIAAPASDARDDRVRAERQAAEDRAVRDAFPKSAMQPEMIDVRAFRAVQAAVAAAPDDTLNAARAAAANQIGRFAESVQAAPDAKSLAAIIKDAAGPIAAFADSIEAATRAAYDAEASDRDRASIRRKNADDDQKQVKIDTAEKISKITVDPPRAASAAAASGGFSGGSMNNQFRLADQRANAIEAIMREEITLLQQILQRLEE